MGTVFQTVHVSLCDVSVFVWFFFDNLMSLQELHKEYLTGVASRPTLRFF